MTISRMSGMVALAADSAHCQPSRSVLDLYPEFLKNLPFGVVLLHLENPQDIKTYRIIDLNPAAAEITGATPEDLLAGHSLISPSSWRSYCHTRDSQLLILGGQ